MSGDPVWQEIIGWLLAAVALYGIGYVVLLVIDTVRVTSGNTPIVTDSGKSIGDAFILALFFLLFYLTMSAVRP